MADDLTEFAMCGYRAQDDMACPHLRSSACWFAWQAGKFFDRTARGEPRKVRMGRGYQVHASGLLVQFDKNLAPYLD